MVLADLLHEVENFLAAAAISIEGVLSNLRTAGLGLELSVELLKALERRSSPVMNCLSDIADDPE
jgi:hypothetical protein